MRLFCGEEPDQLMEDGEMIRLKDDKGTHLLPIFIFLHFFLSLPKDGWDSEESERTVGLSR